MVCRKEVKKVEKKINKKGSVLLIIPTIIAVIVVVVSLMGFRQVDAGEVAVVTQFGKVTGRTLEPGAHLITPLVNGTKFYNTKKVIYETTTGEKQEVSDADYKDYPVDTNTKDGQPVDIFYTVRFSVDSTQAGRITETIGSERDLVEKIVKTESRIWARTIPREFTASELYSGDGVQLVQEKIFEALDPTFRANGLVLDSIGIREIKFTDQYVQAIEAKQIEAVKVETAENIAKRAEYEKEATIKQAEAQAESQRLQSQTITSTFLEKEWIEKWDGKLPTYMLGDSNALIQLPN